MLTLATGTINLRILNDVCPACSPGAKQPKRPNVYLWGGTTEPDMDVLVWCNGLRQPGHLDRRDAYQQERNASLLPLSPTITAYAREICCLAHASVAAMWGCISAMVARYSSGQDHGRNGIGIDSFTAAINTRLLATTGLNSAAQAVVRCHDGSHLSYAGSRTTGPGLLSHRSDGHGAPPNLSVVVPLYDEEESLPTWLSSSSLRCVRPARRLNWSWSTMDPATAPPKSWRTSAKRCLRWWPCCCARTTARPQPWQLGLTLRAGRSSSVWMEIFRTIRPTSPCCWPN